MRDTFLQSIRVKFVHTLFCAILIPFLFACSTERQKIERSDAIRYHLNQGAYEQAIALLKEQLAEYPDDHRSRILLASAYSGSIGINTIDCFEVLRPKLFDKPISRLQSREMHATRAANYLQQSSLTGPESASSSESQESQRRKSILAIERELLKFTVQSADAMETAFRLPHIAIEKRDRIVLSLAVLKQIPKDSSEYLTAQLYEGILSLIQFLNYFRDAIPAGGSFDFHARPWYISVYCQINLNILLPNLKRSADYLSSTFEAMGRAGRVSNNPIYESLAESSVRLSDLSDTYLQNQDLFDLADTSIDLAKSEVCRN